MRIVKAEPFEHEGVKYELRLFSDGWNFTVKAFREGREANGYSYSVTLPTAFDLQKATGTNAVQELFENSKSDIREKIWERYVVAYVESLNLKEDEGVACQKCTNRELQIRMVDNRKMYLCRTCGNIWYKERSTGNGYEWQRDEIADGVAKNGFHEVPWLILLNSSFHEEDGLSTETRLQNWCEQNHLTYSIFEQRDAHGNVQILRFDRKPFKR